MPSSTEAIISARRRISCCEPAAMASSSARDASLVFRRNASAQAGFIFTTSSGGSTFGRGGKVHPS
jgi:hypothetical protein